MHPVIVEAQRNVEEANKELFRLFSEQAQERSKAEKLISQARAILEPLDEAASNLKYKLGVAENLLSSMSEKHLTSWIAGVKESPFYGYRYVYGREQEWYTQKAWLRIGRWERPFAWYLNTFGGQHKLGLADKMSDKEAIEAADKILISLGFLLED
ncbi:MAG: hypothetical protein KDC62_11760 [Aequorivita sp.]|nr:hypothetical protein [Aequorivita sp.]